MHVLVIDFETTYGQPARHPGEQAYTLSTMTTEAYVRDPRFQTIGVGIRNADNTARVWLEHEQFKAWAAAQDWSQIAVIAHHAHFDGLILSHHYGVRPGFWFDTLSMANALRPHSRKSLAKLSELEGIGVKGTEVIQAKGKRREDFAPEEWTQYGVYCLNDCDLEFALYDIYARQFSITELRVMDFTIRQFTEPMLTMNRAVLAQHHQDEIARKKALLEKCGADKSDLMSNPKFAQLLLEYGVEPPMKYSEKQTKTAQEKDPNAAPVYTFAFAKSDPGMKALLEHDDPEVRLLAEARVGVKSTIEETRALRYMGIVDRGLWPVYIAYSKAHTGRAAGGDKSNAQNLKRGGILRDAIEAPLGYKIAVADSAQIEARVLAWLACQSDLVNAFAAGRDIYSEDASEIYNRPVNRKRKEIVDGKETYPDFVPGFVAKVQRLGLGFQMWWPKFASTMLAGALGGPPVQFGRDLIEQMQINHTAFINDPREVNTALAIPTRLSQTDMLVHCIVSKHLVTQYRRKNKAIVSFWELAETAIEAMYEGQEMTFGFNGVLKTEKGAVLLPSGRRMYYPDLAYDVRNAGKKNQRREWTYWNGTERTKIYGGLATENWVQGLARDAVMEQGVHYVDTGRSIAIQTHDELGGVVPDSDAQEAVSTLIQIMKVPPVWAPGLPLSAAGSFATRYGDIEK